MGSTLLMLGAGVLLLRAGLALYLCGVSRSKNAAGAVLRALIDACVAVIAFWAIGAAIVWHQTGLILDWRDTLGPNGFFAMTVVMIGAAIPVGATLERSRFSTIIGTSALLAGLVIPVGWFWAYGTRLATFGLLDIGGATFIHWIGGICALVGALVVGPRFGKYNHDGSSNVIPGHSVPQAAFGVLLTLIGWVPYLAGMSDHPDLIGMSVLLAAAGGAIGAQLYSRFMYTRADVYLTFSGLLGGLVAITAGVGAVSTRGALITGLVAGFLVPYATVTMDLIFKIDDPAASISIHAVGGLWGVLSAAVLSTGTFHDHLHRLFAAAIALVAMGIISGAFTWLIYAAMKATGGIRPREAQEFEGLDLAEHDLNAYPDFQQTMIKSYHMREA